MPEEVDLTSYSISLLNGSGVAGEAGRVKTALVEAGFAEDKMEAGNADKSNYEKTSVSMKENVPDGVYDALGEKLGETYTLERSEAALEESSKFDVIIIVGSKK